MRDPKRFIPGNQKTPKKLKIVLPPKPEKPETFFCKDCKQDQPIHSQLTRDVKYKAPYIWELYKDTCKWCQANAKKSKAGKAAFDEATKLQSKAPSRKDRMVMKQRLRSLVATALRRGSWSKNSDTLSILGADADTVMSHLKAGCIARYGSYDPKNIVYEIDHITPMSTAKNFEEAHMLNHYLNLQLLTQLDNRIKSDKVGARWGNEESFLTKDFPVVENDDEDVLSSIDAELADWRGTK